MPHFDGKYKVISVHLEALVYIISMPDAPVKYTTFHASKLKPYRKNNESLFLSRKLACPVNLPVLAQLS